MSEDPERDDGDEESPDSPASESDPSADAPDDAPTEEPDHEPEPDESEPEPEDEVSTPDSGSEPDSDAPEAASSFDGVSETGTPDGTNPSESVSDESDGKEPGDGDGAEPEGDSADAPSGEPSDEPIADSGDEPGAEEEADDAGDPSPYGPAVDAGEEEYVEEFTVPDMGTADPEDRDIELVDEDEVDEGVPPSEEAGPTLPENQDGVGVDVPQQTLEDDDGDDLWGEGPESDEEMPLADHIEEMMRRLSVVFLVAGVVALTLLGLGQAFEALPTAVELIDALWNNAIPGAPEMEDRRPRLYGPLELILTKLKVTALAGLLIGLPVFVYETYLFMRPGLYRHERRYYLAAVPTSLVLGTIGMAFAHYVIIPAIMDYFTIYTQENVASVAYGLAETFNLILVLMAYMAVVFQIPLFIMLAIMMGLTTRLWLEDKRLLFWGGFLTVAFLINPDPTGMTPFIIAATMIVLYEGTLALLRWTGN